MSIRNGTGAGIVARSIAAAVAKPLDVDVWMLWVRTWGAANAIAYALRSGFRRDDILAANQVARERALKSK